MKKTVEDLLAEAQAKRDRKNALRLYHRDKNDPTKAPRSKQPKVDLREWVKNKIESDPDMESEAR